MQFFLSPSFFLGGGGGDDMEYICENCIRVCSLPADIHRMIQYILYSLYTYLCSRVLSVPTGDKHNFWA